MGDSEHWCEGLQLQSTKAIHSGPFQSLDKSDNSAEKVTMYDLSQQTGTMDAAKIFFEI